MGVKMKDPGGFLQQGKRGHTSAESAQQGIRRERAQLALLLVRFTDMVTLSAKGY